MFSLFCQLVTCLKMSIMLFAALSFTTFNNTKHIIYSLFSSHFQLYCEVRSTRGGAAALDSMKQDDDAVHQLSMRSTSTGSSLLSDNSRSELLSSSTQSEPTRNPPSPGLGPNRNISVDSLHGFNVDVQFSQSRPSHAELLIVPRARETWKQDSSGDNKRAGGTPELEDFYCGAAGRVVPREYVSVGNEKGVHGISPECPPWAGLSYGSEKKKNTTALNAVSVLR